MIGIRAPPFKITEKGWGEFDMSIVLTPVGAPKGGDQTIQHDLNFQQERYESTHTVVSRSHGRYGHHADTDTTLRPSVTPSQSLLKD